VKRRDTLLGLLLLGLVLAGVFWARGRSGPGAGAEGTAGELPDVTLADAEADLGDVRIRLAVTPRPITAFAEHRWQVRAEAEGAVAPLTDGRISFEMRMPMGDHRYALLPTADGWAEAAVVLPSCPSGQRRWFATVEGTVAGRPHSARFQVDLAPPGP
jgi:hypothetical protein